MEYSTHGSHGESAMSDYPARLRALKIMDEVGSDNPLGRDAAAYIEEMEERNQDLLTMLHAVMEAFRHVNRVADELACKTDNHASVTRNKTS